jgi:hypothetical protein
VLEIRYPFAIPFDLLWKKGATIQKVIVRHGKTKMDKRMRRRDVPCIHHSRPLYCKYAAVSIMSMLMESKKWGRSKEEVQNRIDGKVILVTRSGVGTPIGVTIYSHKRLTDCVGSVFLCNFQIEWSFVRTSFFSACIANSIFKLDFSLFPFYHFSFHFTNLFLISVSPSPLLYNGCH